jgi:hypothetical protein
MRMAGDAIRLAGDMTVAARRIGGSNEERNRFEHLALAFSDELEHELSANSIALQQHLAIEAFLDREDESTGSPDCERLLGNSATAMIAGLCDEFQMTLCALLHPTLRRWFEFAQFIEQVLYPQEIVELVFPDDLTLAVWARHAAVTDESTNGEISESWLARALGQFIPPQRVDLRTRPASRVWRRLMVQRGRELGIDLGFLADDDDLPSSVAAEFRVSLIVLLAIGQFAPCNSDDETRDLESAAAWRRSLESTEQCEQVIPPQSTPEIENTAGDVRSFADIFGVTIDENQKELSRRGQSPTSKFPTKGNCIEWQLAKRLLSAQETGTTVAELQKEWAEIGGKEAPSPRTIANKISTINRLMELIGLVAVRELHNGPWIIQSITPLSRSPD